MNAQSGSPDNEGAALAPSAGALLKAAREKRGLHVAALAASIKVSPRKLEALEADRLDELPDLTFTRALAQTVCRTLKIDARPVLARLPAAGPVALVPADEGINQPFRDGQARLARPDDDSPLRRLLMRPMLWGAMLLLVAAVALYFAPLQQWWGLAKPGVPAPVAAPAAPLPSVAAPLPSPPPLVASSPVPEAVVPAASAAAAASTPRVESVFSTPPAGVVPESTPPQGALRIKVSEASWIEVRDRRGVALLSRTVSPGELVGLDGAEPFLVVVGNIEATELVFRGQVVDLAARGRENVARFRLP